MVSPASRDHQVHSLPVAVAHPSGCVCGRNGWYCKFCVVAWHAQSDTFVLAAQIVVAPFSIVGRLIAWCIASALACARGRDHGVSRAIARQAISTLPDVRIQGDEDERRVLECVWAEGLCITRRVTHACAMRAAGRGLLRQGSCGMNAAPCMYLARASARPRRPPRRAHL